MNEIRVKVFKELEYYGAASNKIERKRRGNKQGYKSEVATRNLVREEVAIIAKDQWVVYIREKK